MSDDGDVLELSGVKLALDKWGMMRRLLLHDREQGGTLATLTGLQGCGKTNAQLVMAYILASLGEKVLWRGRQTDFFNSFPGPVKVLADRDVVVSKIAWDDGDVDALDIPVHRFRGPEDLLRQAEPGVLNVFYARKGQAAFGEDGKTLEERPFLGRLLKAIVDRPSADWIDVFVDELHEDLGDRPQGAAWHYQREVRDTLADFRKCFAGFYGATHHYDECDEAILKKIQFHLYMRGARPPRWTVLRNKQLPLFLSPGEAIIESGNFGRIQFPKLARPRYQLRVIDSLDAQIERDDADVARGEA